VRESGEIAMSLIENKLNIKAEEEAIAADENASKKIKNFDF